MIKIHGGFAMRYAVFSLTALFLTACADADNPVVYTAPAGKAVANDEVKQPPGTNFGSYEEVPYVPVDPPETAAHTIANPTEEDPDANIHTQSEINRHRTDPLPSANNGCIAYIMNEDGTYMLDANGNKITERVDCWWKRAGPSDTIRREYRDQQLREDGVLPTISVSGCKDDDNNAVFTFRRNGPTDETLAFTFSVSGVGGKRVSAAFGVGKATREWNGGTFGSQGMSVWLEPGWLYYSGDYIVGTSELTVRNSTGGC